MGKFELSIVDIPRRKPLEIDEETDVAEIVSEDCDSGSLKRLRVHGDMSAVAQDFLFQGTVEGVFASPCDRCLEPAEVTESLDVSWLFEPGVEPDPLEALADAHVPDEDDVEALNTDDDDQVRFYEGESIDLGPHAWEELIMTAPSKIYCNDDCKGLCPQCGVNLNETTCECVEEELEESNNSGFSALKDMFPDLPDHASEE